MSPSARSAVTKLCVCDKVVIVCERCVCVCVWKIVRDKVMCDNSCNNVLCERLCVANCTRKTVCDKVVCERLCVTKLCVVDMCERLCVCVTKFWSKNFVRQSCMWKIVYDKAVCDHAYAPSAQADLGLVYGLFGGIVWRSFNVFFAFVWNFVWIGLSFVSKSIAVCSEYI